MQKTIIPTLILALKHLLNLIKNYCSLGMVLGKKEANGEVAELSSEIPSKEMDEDVSKGGLIQVAIRERTRIQKPKAVQNTFETASLLILFLSIFLFQCSSTRHNAFPAYGYTLNTNTTVIVGVHNNTIINPRETKLLMKTLENCEADLIDISTIHPSAYRSFFDLNSPDSIKLKAVEMESKADYLLLGTFKAIEAPGGLLSHGKLNQYDLVYNMADFEPKSVFEFTLYDLSEKREVLSVTTTTKPRTLIFESKNSPSEHWVHPTSPLMLLTNFKKARKKIKKLCQC